MTQTGAWSGPTVPEQLRNKHGSEIRRVPVAELVVDTAYQRDLDADWVQDKMKRGGFKLELCGAIYVSSRAGKLWVVEGQKRVQLARESGVPTIYALVIPGLSQAEEAEMFRTLQKSRVNLGAWDLYKADLTAKDPEALAVQEIVLKAGFRLDRHDDRMGAISAVEAIRHIYRLGGEELLVDTLALVRRVWTLDEPMASRGVIMRGLALFLYCYRAEAQFDRERLIGLLEASGPARLVREAQRVAYERNALNVGYAMYGEAIRQLYNARLSRTRQLGPLRIERAG